MTTDAVYDTQQAIRLVRAHAEEWSASLFVSGTPRVLLKAAPRPARLRVGRSHCRNLDPRKIGMCGFSAGAELTAAAAMFYNEFDAANADDALGGVSSRPDFAGLMWPGPTPFETKNSQLMIGASRLHGMSPRSKQLPEQPPPPIPADVPPSFAACAGTGDRIHAIWALQWYDAMLEHSVPNIEMHLYGTGVHGGGLKNRDDTPFGTWQDRFIAWYRELGFLGPRGEETKAARDVQEFAAMQEALPRVLLLGDSISQGYHAEVARLLEGRVVVSRPAANCGSTVRGLEELEAWLVEPRAELSSRPTPLCISNWSVCV